MGRQRTLGDLNLQRIEPLNNNQLTVLSSNRNLVLSGYAGTGKTFLATVLAFRSILKQNHNKLIYIRSAVPTRDLGFLPGSEEEKLKVYEAPYQDIVSKLFDRGDAYDILKHKGYIDFMSTSFIRGINLRNSYIVVDECQNMTYHELDSIITRLEENCSIIFCGDIRQADLTKNGAADFYRVLKNMDSFNFIEFTKDDIVRSNLVKDYIIKKEQILNKF